MKSLKFGFIWAHKVSAEYYLLYFATLLSSYRYTAFLRCFTIICRYLRLWIYGMTLTFNILQVKLDTSISIYISIYTYIYSNLRGPIGTSPYGLTRYWAGLGPPSPCLISIAHAVMDSFEAKSNEEILDHELYDVLVQSCNLLSKEKIQCREAP
jgi:hypothetical protein